MSKSKKNGKHKTNGHSKTSGQKRTPYPYEKFVEIWTRSSSVAEVVTATGLSKNTVSALSTKLRKNKVPLKVMPRRTARVIDATALTKIIKQSSTSPRA